MKHNHKTRRFGLFSLSLAICLMVGLLSGVVAYGKAVPAQRGEVIEPGVDVWVTDAGETYTDFADTPIPSHFFGKGSKAFAGKVEFKGVPIESLSGADTAVERKDPIELPEGETRIELTELSLVSAEPIAVRSRRGTQLWDVHVALSKSKASEGSMVVRQTSERGGTFDSEFTVHPLFTFVRQSDGAKRELDGAKLGLDLTLIATEAPWSSERPDSVVDAGLSRGFYTGVDPVSQRIKPIPHNKVDNKDKFPASHTVKPPTVPAPSDEVIKPGVDVWVTDAAETYTDFTDTPIPPHFFDEGSEKFDGKVYFKGVPIDSLSGGDTAVERKDPIHLPEGETSIELTELSLASVNAIAVSIEGGGVQLWDVYAGLSESKASEGSMVVRQDLDAKHVGGTFDSEFTVYTLFTFVRQSDGKTRVLDAADIGAGLTLTVHDVPWSSELPDNVVDTGLSPGFYTEECTPHTTPKHSHQVGAPSSVSHLGTCDKERQ